MRLGHADAARSLVRSARGTTGHGRWFGGRLQHAARPLLWWALAYHIMAEEAVGHTVRGVRGALVVVTGAGKGGRPRDHARVIGVHEVGEEVVGLLPAEGRRVPVCGEGVPRVTKGGR